jgi:hypothetical protein
MSTYQVTADPVTDAPLVDSSVVTQDFINHNYETIQRFTRGYTDRSDEELKAILAQVAIEPTTTRDQVLAALYAVVRRPLA